MHAREVSGAATDWVAGQASGQARADATESAPSVRAGHVLPCSNPGQHHHRPLPAHNEASCPVCAGVGHALVPSGATLPGCLPQGDATAACDPLILARTSVRLLPSRAPPRLSV